MSEVQSILHIKSDFIFLSDLFKMYTWFSMMSNISGFDP